MMALQAGQAEQEQAAKVVAHSPVEKRVNVTSGSFAASGVQQ